LELGVLFVKKMILMVGAGQRYVFSCILKRDSIPDGIPCRIPRRTPDGTPCRIPRRTPDGMPGIPGIISSLIQ